MQVALLNNPVAEKNANPEEHAHLGTNAIDETALDELRQEVDFLRENEINGLRQDLVDIIARFDPNESIKTRFNPE